MKTPYKFLLVASLLTLSAAQANASATVAMFASPDQNRPECAASPAELASKPEVAAALNTFGGLPSVIGTWKLSGIPFVNQLISFSANDTAFFVQSGNEPQEEVSLCAHTNANGQVMLRVAVHTPGCPENRNIYVRATGENEMSLTAYATRAIGTVKFRRRSPTPLPPGTPAPPVACAAE